MAEKMYESTKKAQAKYDKAHAKYYSLKLIDRTDSDIIEKLESVDKVQSYIKSLIRADIEKKKQ